MHYTLKTKSSLVLIILCLGSMHFAKAQNKKSGEIGVSLGGGYYLGEYNTTPFIGTKIAAGAFYRHTFDTRFAVTGNLFYSKLSGKESNSDYITNGNAPQNFKNTIYEFTPVAEFNFIPFLPGKPKKYYFTPYVFAGLGVAYYPTDYTQFVFNLPFGVGAKYCLGQKFVFAVFAGMRKTFSDKLDYEYSPPTTNNPVDQWGYTGNKDWYSIFGLSLSYKINYRMKCPAFD
ncbi:MAG: DUF6089 family protein [Salinivirgaceae bacterium]|jgi:hypothetical protein|nr:DUF6089 family protein [Salinivirgaceae bacterium]